jgi:hypothetical protein
LFFGTSGALADATLGPRVIAEESAVNWAHPLGQIVCSF